MPDVGAGKVHWAGTTHLNVPYGGKLIRSMMKYDERYFVTISFLDTPPTQEYHKQGVWAFIGIDFPEGGAFSRLLCFATPSTRHPHRNPTTEQ